MAGAKLADQTAALRPAVQLALILIVILTTNGALHPAVAHLVLMITMEVHHGPNQK